MIPVITSFCFLMWLFLFISLPPVAKIFLYLAITGVVCIIILFVLRRRASSILKKIEEYEEIHNEESVRKLKRKFKILSPVQWLLTMEKYENERK